jgi:hypothetical protein
VPIGCCGFTRQIVWPCALQSGKLFILRSTRQGLPGYTFKRAPGELWRSRYDLDQNVIVINNGHRDFVYASKTRALKLRYICRLFAKELVCKNFPGYSSEQLLERMIELLLYTEENLK